MANKEKLGVKNVEEVFDAFLVFLKTGKETLSDGFQVSDSFAIFQAVLGPQIQAAFADSDQIAKELRNADADQKRQLAHKVVDFAFDGIALFAGEETAVVSIEMPKE
ncbi:MAG: hypothetical protein WBA41_23150 [Rivularia sp. (in: cyanobacteria)]